MTDKTKSIEPSISPSGVEGGRRPTGAPEGESPTEVIPKAARRKFPTAYKLKIVKEADNFCEHGQIGAFLRREGLYSSQLAQWRQQIEKGAIKGLQHVRGRRPTRSAADKDLQAAQREIARIKEHLRKANLIIDVQKKVSEILGQPLPETKLEESQNL